MANFAITSPVTFADNELIVQASNNTLGIVPWGSSCISPSSNTFTNNATTQYAPSIALYMVTQPYSIQPVSLRPMTGLIFPR